MLTEQHLLKTEPRSPSPALLSMFWLQGRDALNLFKMSSPAVFSNSAFTSLSLFSSWDKQCFLPSKPCYGSNGIHITWLQLFKKLIQARALGLPVEPLKCLGCLKAIKCLSVLLQPRNRWVPLGGDEQPRTPVPISKGAAHTLRSSCQGRAVSPLSEAEPIGRTLLCLAAAELLQGRAAGSAASPCPGMCRAGEPRAGSSLRLCRRKARSSHPARRAAGHLLYEPAGWEKDPSIWDELHGSRAEKEHKYFPPSEWAVTEKNRGVLAQAE